MEKNPKLEKVEITLGPPDNPYAKIMRTDTDNPLIVRLPMIKEKYRNAPTVSQWLVAPLLVGWET